MAGTIYIRDYVNLPCEDASDGIAEALKAAKETNAEAVVFEKGVYPLIKSVSFPLSFVPNKDGIYEGEGYDNAHIYIKDFENFKFIGAVDENGEPATTLMGYNHGKLNETMPSILRTESGNNIEIANFRLLRNLDYCTAAVVKEITGSEITVEVREGCPCYDGMGTFCMNRFSPDGSTLIGNSLTFGAGADGKTFKKIGDRLLLLDDEKVASKIEVNDIITFHQGACEPFQCHYRRTKNLTLKNLRTVNTSGFGMLAYNVHNLYTERLVFKPEGNQLFVGPRDAFKLQQCNGEIVMKNMHVEGVRMDGQNMHSVFLVITEIIDDKTLKIFKRNQYDDLVIGSDMEFCFGTETVRRKITGFLGVEKTKMGEFSGHIYTVEFDSLPEGLTTENRCFATCFEPDSYTCIDSEFVNVAGAGHLARIDNMEIVGCRYKNMMNSGILLGCEYGHWTEGGHATNIHITDCEFDSCGNTSRYKGKGCIGIKSGGISGIYNKNIHIENCSFKNSDIGVDIHDAEGVIVENCRYENIKENVQIEQETTKDVIIR